MGRRFSGRDFSASTVGYAGLSAMCRPDSSGGINQMTLGSQAGNAGVVAHEMGTCGEAMMRSCCIVLR